MRVVEFYYYFILFYLSHGNNFIVNGRQLAMNRRRGFVGPRRGGNSLMGRNVAKRPEVCSYKETAHLAYLQQ